jgi:hypothetical protein
MRASSAKMLVSLAVLGVLAAGLAFVCARGLRFSDPDPVRPSAVALQEPAWPAPKALPAPQVSTEAGRAIETPPSGAPAIRDQALAAETATQLLNGFLGPARPDGSWPVQGRQITPDQAASAARTATDLINGMLANGGQGRIGAPAPIDPDDAAAVAQSAAKMLNGMFGGRELTANDSDRDYLRAGPDLRPEHKRGK